MAAQDDTAVSNGVTEAAAVPQGGNEAKVESISNAKGEQNKGKNFISEFFVYFQLLVYANPTWIDIVLLVTGTVSAAAAGVPFPLMGILFGQLVDDLNTASCDAQTPDADEASRIQSSIDSKVLELTYIGIASFALIYIYIVCWSIFSRRLEARIRDRYFQALLQQDATFYDQRQAGELSSRLNADVQAVQSGTSEKVGICIACTSFFLTAYIVAFIKNWRLAAMLLSLIPAFFLMAGLGSAFTAKFTSAMSDAIGSASSIAQETLSNIAVVQAFGAGPRLEAKFSSHMMNAQKKGIKKAFAAAVQAGTLYFIAYAANALSFWQGSHQIVKTIADPSGVSVGEIYTVIFLLVDACVVFGSIAPLLPLLGGASTAFQKLRQDIETPAIINSGSDSGLKLSDSAAASISFRNVTFAYISRPDQPVLKNVSFDCPAGKYTAIVGLSGSGKSTVAGLTTRIYDPQDGEVLLDGHDLKQLNVKNLRSFISLVQQEPSLLDRSILENIALGLFNSPWEKYQKFQSIILGQGLAEVAAKVREGQDLTSVAQAHSQDMAELIEMVRSSASLADASGFIDRLEYGYGTIVGTAGKLVSGGQRQRLAFARALIRDPKILLLDEATASLDSASERRIQEAVESISKGRTIIAIAHRLSTIKNADNIIVMNNGEIIEQGTHLELMALDGSYAGMVRLQNLASKEQDDTPSLSSTSKGDADIILSEKESALDEAIPTTKEELSASTSNVQESGREAVAGEDKTLDDSQSAWTIIKSLGRMLRPHLLMLLLAVFSAVIVGGTFSSAGVIFGNTVEKVSPCNSTHQILWAGKFFGGLFFMLAVVELFAYTGSWYGFGYIAEKLLYKIRVLTFRSLYEQELDWHQSEGRSPASLLSIITADAAAVGGFSGSIMGTMFSIVVNFLVAIILSHIIAWKIAIVCLVTVPILLGSGIMQVRSLSRFERKHAGAFSNALGITVEAVTSFKTVSSLSIEEEILHTYRRALKAPQREMALASAYTNFWLAIANSVGNLIYAFAYWWGSTRITKGEYSQAQFFIILMAMLVSAQLWGQMFTLAPEVSRSRAAASRILSLINLGSSKRLDTEDTELDTSSRGEKDIEAIPDAASSRVLNSSRGGATITFRDVSFAYPARPHIQILKGMSFTIPAGQFCGLVGPSGAGKSTIMSLVQRMYRPTGGAVEIDGVDICAREGVDFRHDIAVVPQDCALFDGTIKFNVGLGAVPGHEASDSEIEEACKLANIHNTIMSLPEGYETECGPNGSRLSGGQRQRLAIARALVRKPRLLLLDESTSALDAESERALQEGLEQAARGITVIAITHRLHTVRKADVIFVVEGGQVVDRGRHEELVERSESYRINALQQIHETLKRNPRLRQPHEHHNAPDHSTPTIQPPERPGNPSSSVPVTDLTASSVNGNPRSTGAFERGGSVQLAASPDIYELSDYKEIADRSIIEDRQRQREEKKALKRQWLETQDEMKFSHSIQFNAVPDWSSHYIAYSNLKKLIYQLEKNAHQARAGDAESRPLISNEEPEDVFSKSLGIELEKICSFYSLKEGELLEEVSQLLRDVGEGPSLETSTTLRPTQSETQSTHARPSSLRSHGSEDDDSATDDDETTGLTRHKGKYGRRRTAGSIPDMTASSDFGRSRRYSTTIDDYGDQSFIFGSTLYSSGIMLKKRIISLYVQLCELKSYVQLNKTGFSKVLKKFDKILDKELRSSYISTYVDTAYPFKPDTKKLLDENIAKMEVAYADVVLAGDEELAKKDLRSHLREHVVWERNTVWRDLIGIERRAEAARFGQTLLGQESGIAPKRLQGDDETEPAETQIKTPIGRIVLPSWLSNSSVLTLFISVAAFLLLLFIPILENAEQQNCLALLVFVSLMWATETIPLFVTSLFIPFLAVVLRVVREEDPSKPPKRLTSKEATAAIFSSMWSPVIMLLIGGFTLAAALSKCKIDKRLATLILSKAGTQPRTVLIATMFVAAFASMLISNVAAPVLCFSIIEPMLRTLPSDSNMSKAVIIGIALASNIGGMLSPIASPQNVVAMGIMSPEPTWLQWFFIVIPVGVVSIVLIWLLLLITFQPGKGTSIVPIRPLKEKFNAGQWFVTIVTIITIALWCTSHTLESVFGDMGVVAIIPIVLFFGIGILTKEDFNNFPWTIIILAAGGLSLGKAVRSSGLLHTLAELVSHRVEGMSLYGVLVVFSSLILVIATFISHTVAALIFLPLVYDVGVAMDQPHPNLLVMGGVLMCSAAMGLPTSGFPNMTAIMKEDATGQRYLSVKHFISRGVPSSLITLVVVVTLGYGIMEVAGLD
ncbi:ABC transporter [Trichoderma pleuroticola]